VRRTAALIAGGGPAGAAAAIALARQGTRPLLIEREHTVRDTVCGGFLGWDALAQLDALGIDVAALGARPIDSVRIITGNRTAEAALPDRAAGLSRRTLDSALLQAAEAAGAGIERGVRLRSADPIRREILLSDTATIGCDALFLATGKHELRGVARAHGREVGTLAIGLRARLGASPALTAALAGVIELHLFDGGYAGLLLQEDGSTNLCLSVSPERLAGLRPEALAAALAQEAPALGARLDAAASVGRWSAIAGIPYGWRATSSQSGIFRIGDQSAVIASLAGDGIAMALASGREAAACLLRSGPEGAVRFQRDRRRHVALPIAVAGLLRSVAEQHPHLRSGFVALFREAPALVGFGARLTRGGHAPNRGARH